MARKKLAKQFNSFKDMSIGEFDFFVSCIKELVNRCPYIIKDKVELFYVNRIERDFRFVYNTDGHDLYSWKYDSNDAYPTLEKGTIENAVSASTMAQYYILWTVYKLFCLYFFNDETLLEDLYARAKREALDYKDFYNYEAWRRKDREDQYGEQYSIESHTKQLLKEALSERSGKGHLWKSPLYKVQTKRDGLKKVITSSDTFYWKYNDRVSIKPTTNSLFGAIIFNCSGKSKYRAFKAINEIDAKIDAFLKRKAEEEKKA